MTAITVLDKGNVPTGPFTRDQIAEKLSTGEFSLDDLAFIEGLAQWTPLRDVLAKVDGAVPAPAPVITAPVAPAAVSAPAYSYAATMQPPSHIVYGGFWLRFLAYMIDALILSIPVIVVCVVIGVFVGGFAALTGGLKTSDGDNSNNVANTAIPVGIVLFEGFLFVGLTVISWLYYAFLESGPQQSTFGKRAMGLRVTNMEGSRISFGHASGRFFSKIVTGLLPFAIGYIMAAFTERKQALHDMIAGTLVVRG